ncbi:hypothetical protein Voc01_059930 [Virgisporangium ochraceum]|uniref:HTH luxR-type domain-containing protein n=1 Tax=Virgisporangium ochraceum TaxID=65505 RepID=A0A8J4A1D3_9ACTN|nr:hypothetical protein Voc01_059930 [Virgisporangium ochraceum]
MTRRVIHRFPRTPQGRSAAARATERLTEREAEVLRLVARGPSNAELAAELHLSEATVKTHLTRVSTNLDLRDRVQAVVFAYEHGLVTPGATD